MDIRDDRLEGGLFAAFQSPEGESVLESIQRLHKAGSSILLRDPDDGASPVLLRRDETAKGDRRFQILGEIARGGIGVVYKGRDRDLNRDVALKVLRKELADREDVVQRFIEEAQVGGQLQHPGIVPIYALGLQDDGRPSFAMKLIKGKTLAELLDNNPRGIDLIAVFEQVAQTMAYAHSRGVIHRDLKPANVMIGAFGEVQVVDWGFAKVLGHEELKRPEHTVIATVRSEDEGSGSIAGSVMGTPAYMPPEQAMGRIDELDESSDVFALGAILCEILTGQQVYTGKQKDQLIAASQCRLDPALERIKKADAADELKQIVRDCLQPLTDDRPSTAGVLSDRLAQHFASVEERARESELDALGAESRAAGEQYRKRRALTLAAIAIVAIVAGGGGTWWWKSEQDSRESRAATAIADATRLALRFEGDQDWTRALAAAQKAVDLARSEGVDDSAPRAIVADLEGKRAAADEETRLQEAEARLLAELEDARALARIHYGQNTIERAYANAVNRHPIDPQRLRNSPHAARFAAALDHWGAVRRWDGVNWSEQDSLARAIDPEHNALRDAITDGSALESLVAELDVETTPTSMIEGLAQTLLIKKKHAAAAQLLDRALQLYPGDYWLHMRRGSAAGAMDDHALAISHYTCALAARPEAVEPRHWIGVVLVWRGDVDGAIEIWREAVKRRPDWTHGRYHIVKALTSQKKHVEAHQEWAKAIAERPNDDGIHITAGFDYLERNDLVRAIRHYKEAVRLVPDSADHHTNLGIALIRRYGFQRAVARYRRIVGDSPHVDAYTVMYAVLEQQGKYEDAERALELAMEVDPKDPEIYQNLANLRRVQGRFEESIAAKRKALELGPDHAEYHYDMGTNLWQVSQQLQDDRGIEEAIEHLRGALRIDSHYAEAWCNLGFCYRQLARWTEARDAFRKGHAIGSERENWDYPSAKWLELAEEMVLVEKRLPAVLRGDDHPGNANEALALATMALFVEKDYAGATRLYRWALERTREINDHDYTNAACAAASAGETDQAVAWLRKTMEKYRGRAPERWKTDVRLAAIRTEKYKDFWAEVEAMR